MIFVSVPEREAVEAQTTVAVEETFFLPENMFTGLPAGETRRLTVTSDRLLQGKLLLVDEAHPIPDGVEAPNTLGILGYTHGRVACRDQQAQLGKEALVQLEEMCVDARNRGIGGLTVTAGTRSREQQRSLLSERVDALSRDMSMEEAVAQAKQQVSAPGYSEHQLPWTVDIRICRGWNRLPEDGPLSASEEGCWLTEHAWAYGFIQRWPEADPDTDNHRPYCFRYVGPVHAELMHTLGMTLEEYLSLLRHCGAVTLRDETGAPGLSAVCIAAGERQTVFDLPEAARVEDASLDNCGWAVLSVTYR